MKNLFERDCHKKAEREREEKKRERERKKDAPSIVSLARSPQWAVLGQVRGQELLSFPHEYMVLHTFFLWRELESKVNHLRLRLAPIWCPIIAGMTGVNKP